MTSLSQNVKFSIEKDSPEGSFIVRSKTESFNLDHIVDKDIVSFYGELSKYGIVDTGILPLFGTGTLAIRSAGNHSQITFQHAPQVNYITWGAHEGDPDAQTYLVAQPYRIWIGDILDGNLLGARMFYSPYPITSAVQPLYHLNLPNTNCRGYRGTGVGWQCLYHNQDWSQLPFNEKVARFAERCSGAEAFNDNNMSETDGPGFYKDYYHENGLLGYDYLWNPTKWQNKTQQDGLDWVLNEQIWIPILVHSLDRQDRHVPNGIPLTLGMAMIGNYQAYYTDNLIPKPINALTRSDLSSDVNSDKVASWIMRSHNSSKVAYVPRNSIDESTKHREQVLLNSPTNNGTEDEEEENHINIVCPITGNQCTVHEDDTMVDSLDNVYCSSCFESNTVYCENTESYLPENSEYLYYDDAGGCYYNVEGLNYANCSRCGEFHSVPKHESLSKLVFQDEDDNDVCCVNCLNNYVKETHSGENGNCYKCICYVPLLSDGDIPEKYSSYFKKAQNVYLNTDPFGVDFVVVQDDLYCVSCYDKSFQCPAGHRTWLPLAKLPDAVANHSYEFHNNVTQTVKTVQITHLCSSCSNPEIWQDGLTEADLSKFSTYFSIITKAEDRFRYAFDNDLISNSPYITQSVNTFHDTGEITHKE